jgi:hypothetical protein
MTVDPVRAALVADLRALGANVPQTSPAATATIADAVLARLVAAPAPARRPRPALVARSTLARMRTALAGRRRAVVAVVVALLVSLLAAPPVRAAVAEWFGFGGVEVRIEPAPHPSTAPPPPPAGATGTLAEARAALGFAPLVPTALGTPDAVEVSADRRLVSMSWTDGPDGPIRLDQWAADLDGLAAKTAPGAQFTSVGGAFALWFDSPHEVVLLAPDGSRRTESARLAGQTLIWRTPRATLRLEGDLTLARAVEIAGSARPWVEAGAS